MPYAKALSKLRETGFALSTADTPTAAEAGDQIGNTRRGFAAPSLRRGRSTGVADYSGGILGEKEGEDDSNHGEGNRIWEAMRVNDEEMMDHMHETETNYSVDTDDGPLGMIGGVKADGGYWQGLDSAGKAHANNPDYVDYSQGPREYTFEEKPGYVLVGERNGRKVYAAPDYAKDKDGNYLAVSSNEYKRLAKETGALLPTREEVKSLLSQAKHITMPTFANGIGTSEEYTKRVKALMGDLPEGTVVAHAKEFYAPASTRKPTPSTGSERMMLARTLQAEAGNQGYEGMLDVGAVILNRANSKNNRFGKGIAGVILKPGQFSAWNSKTGYAGGEQGQNMNFTPNKTALKAADAILSGNYKDRTGGATHYYAVIQGVSGVPSWSNSSFKRIDGAHYFGKAR